MNGASRTKYSDTARSCADPSVKLCCSKGADASLDYPFHIVETTRIPENDAGVGARSVGFMNLTRCSGFPVPVLLRRCVPALTRQGECYSLTRQLTDAIPLDWTGLLSAPLTPLDLGCLLLYLSRSLILVL